MTRVANSEAPAALVAAGPRSLAWQREGLCAQTDPEAFHPEIGGDSKPAKRVCAVCPVQPECLAYAVAHPELVGIWGGLTGRQRQRLRRQYGQAA